MDNKEKERLLNFITDFSQLTIKYFADRNEVATSNLYTGKVSIHKLRKIKDNIIEKIEEIEIKNNVY